MTTPQGLIYDTNVLIEVVPNLKTSQNFLLDRFFPITFNSDTEYVSIDVDVGKRRLSPFVSPLVQGKVVEARRIQTNVFKPPYIKDKRAPDLRRPVRRMLGERIGGVLTPTEREMANIAFEMTDQIDMLNRRLEWMAANALRTGTVTIQGEGFPLCLIDFGRDASLTIAKTGTGKWTVANVTAGNASPTGDIEAWQRQILKLSGARVDTIIFTTSAWQGFISDPLLKGAIYYPKLGDAGNTINAGPQIAKGAVYKGQWGQYSLWIYNDWYVDSGTEGGTAEKEYPMIPDGNIIMTGPDLMGTRAYATIMDPEHNYATMSYAPKTWTEKDPAQRYLMMQASPIVIPARANAAIGATVCDPVYDV